MSIDRKIVVPDIIREIVEETEVRFNEWNVLKNPDAEYVKIQFYADQLRSINGDLSAREQTMEGKKNKYPAIMLVDPTPVKYSTLVEYVEADVHILIVTDTFGKISESADNRRKLVYKPVLYPILECFKDAIENHIQVFGTSDTWTEIDRYRLNSSFSAEPKSQSLKSLFPDYIDGIEIYGLKINFIETC